MCEAKRRPTTVQEKSPPGIEPRRGRGSVLLREHDREHPLRYRRVARIVRSVRHAAVVIVDLPKELMLSDLQGTEVVFAVRIVVHRELVERLDALDRLLLQRNRQGINTRGSA